MNKEKTMAGQAVYSKKVLSIYDFWVLGVSNHYFWKCPTKLIREQFSTLVSPNHLDVGVGSGYYLKNCLPQTTKRIALLDLNENSLETASKAIHHFQPEVYCGDVLEPLDLNIEKFDSISVNYLLHCLPGSFNEKGVMFGHLKSQLNDGGVLFGSTILGKGTKQNFFAKKLMGIYNKKGIFSNHNDELDALVASLNEYFTDVKVELIGCVALFSAKKPS
ncbi:class I SAM-dependent methyltransferase [Photobacterium rosenbergii]|uniref:class I SAM-dependent methyltransferase n=1 Tax=Photobacterium rosenbergii TaxID=294936 RepID=UPI001C991FCE|nr:class I SAM-dependent methyltransferase [Photobacterium rosenbergii]MBY5946016.1 class I SAM-dependent methyltransferase [Photobacterium rosenbergii]